jgi:hypothetical protein
MKLATASIISLVILRVSPGSVVLAHPDKEEIFPSIPRSHLRKIQDINTSSSMNRRRFLVTPGFLPSRAANRGEGTIRTNGQLSKIIDVSKIAYARAGARFGVSGWNNMYAPRNSKANRARSVPKIRGMAVDGGEPLDESAVPSGKPTIDSAASIAIAIAAYHRVHLPLVEDERPRRRENVGMIGRRMRSSTTSNSRDEPRLPRHHLKPNRLAGKFIDGRDAIEGSSRRRGGSSSTSSRVWSGLVRWPLYNIVLSIV